MRIDKFYIAADITSMMVITATNENEARKQAAREFAPFLDNCALFEVTIEKYGYINLKTIFDTRRWHSENND